LVGVDLSALLTAHPLAPAKPSAQAVPLRRRLKAARIYGMTTAAGARSHTRRGDGAAMQIRIEGTDLPGRTCGPDDSIVTRDNIHVGVQRRGRPSELLDVQPGDAPMVTWTLDCTVVPAASGVDINGPYIQGPPGGRFIYLSWGSVDETGIFAMFRRAKLWLNAIEPDIVNAAAKAGLLTARLGLTDARGHPLCASVRPPLIEWFAVGSAD
jgi:hypothetical protein